jgi:hypothetical protein
MSLWPNLNRYNAGEWSPRLDGRWDLDDYSAALRKCDGYLPLKYGPAERITGSEYVADAKFADKKSRLIRFRFSATVNYIMEFGDQYIRWFLGGTTASRLNISPPVAWVTATGYSVGDLVEESGTNYYCLEDHTSGVFATDLGAGKWYALSGVIYEIPSPYLEGDLFDLQFVQINDIIYIVGENYAPRKLSRVGDTNWQLEEVQWTFPPMLDINSTATTVYPSHVSGTGRTLTASSSIFTSDMEDGYFAITQTRDAQEQVVDLESTATAQTAAIKVKGTWAFNTQGTWTATLKIQRRINGGAWEDLKEVSGAENANYALSGVETSNDAEYRIDYNVTAVSGTDGEARFQVDAIEVTGFAKITTASGTTATVDIISDFEKAGSANAVTTWTEGAFSNKRGFPTSVAFFETKLIFGGTDFQKQRIWLSVVDDFENFGVSTPDILATDSMTYQFASTEQNRIKWIASQKFLLIGTEGEEYSLRGADGNALSPSVQPLATVESTEGSKSIRPIIVGDSMLFWSRDGRRLNELIFTVSKDGFGAKFLLFPKMVLELMISLLWRNISQIRQLCNQLMCKIPIGFCGARAQTEFLLVLFIIARMR